MTLSQGGVPGNKNRGADRVRREPGGARAKGMIEILAVMAGLAAVTVLIAALDGDRWLAARIWTMGRESWPGVGTVPWAWLYHWAPVPALAMAAAALLVLAGSLWRPGLRRWRRPALFVVLAIALGSGLVVNLVFKDHWGRARPGELVEFRGSHAFTQVWQPGRAAPNSSFPSGHASIGFSVLLPWFIFRGRHRILAAVFLGSGLLFGFLVGVARMLQGGHYLSDIVWAGGLVYLCGAALALILPPAPS